MSQNETLAALTAAGVSVWLDDLSRDRLNSGNLAALRDTKAVVGVTTNPSIFQAALSAGHAYEQQLDELAARGADVDGDRPHVDHRRRAGRLRPVHRHLHGHRRVDGRVSIEVDPRLAATPTQTTIDQAMELHKIVDRPNVLIKIPATEAGLPAITAVIGEGISVNVTLIFSVERYRAVMDAYLAGLEQRHQAGHDLSEIHSVASFFVSRVDTEIDKRLEQIGTDGGPGAARSGRASPTPDWPTRPIEQVFVGGDRCEPLKAEGANKQRPLWASTGVEEPAVRRHPVRRRARRPEHREHRAGEDHRRGRRPRRHQRRHRHRHRRRRPQRSSPSSKPSAST